MYGRNGYGQIQVANPILEIKNYLGLKAIGTNPHGYSIITLFTLRDNYFHHTLSFYKDEIWIRS